MLQALFQGDIHSESRRAAEQDFSESREREREITVTQRLCKPFLTLSQKDLVAPQRGGGVSTSSFYDKVLFWPGIC